MKFIGHRGDQSFAIENTLYSFRDAIKHGVDMIELDIQLTLDRQWVVYHDLDLKRLYQLNLKIKELTCDQLFQIGYKSGTKISSLEEVIKFISNRVDLYLDIKGHYGVNEMRELMELVIKNGGDLEQVYFASTSKKTVRSLLRIKSHMSESIKIGFIVHEYGDIGYVFKNNSFLGSLRFIVIKYDLLTPELLQKLRLYMNSDNNNREIYVYTINDLLSLNQ